MLKGDLIDISENSGIIKETDISNQKSTSLKRAIRKYDKQIKEHNAKINNPETYIANWDTLS